MATICKENKKDEHYTIFINDIPFSKLYTLFCKWRGGVIVLISLFSRVYLFIAPTTTTLKT